MEITVPNTLGRYSINEKGEVFSNYRFLKGGVKWKRKEIVKKTRNANVGNSPTFTEFRNGKIYKKHFVNVVMTKLFKIKPPDNRHLYDVVTKHGDFFNNGIKNLTFRIRTLKDADWKFYPQPFYDKTGKIIYKICACCGIKKNISEFSFNSKKESYHLKTYRNISINCRCKRSWIAIKSDAARLAIVTEYQKKWSRSKNGIKYYQKYRKDNHLKNKNQEILILKIKVKKI